MSANQVICFQEENLLNQNKERVKVDRFFSEMSSSWDSLIYCINWESIAFRGYQQCLHAMKISCSCNNGSVLDLPSLLGGSFPNNYLEILPSLFFEVYYPPNLGLPFLDLLHLDGKQRKIMERPSQKTIYYFCPHLCRFSIIYCHLTTREVNK